MNGLRLLIFTPVTPGGLRHETVASVTAQQTQHRVDWKIGRCNPYPVTAGDNRNVLAQYSYGRELCLSGPYDAMLCFEQDMTMPPHAVQALCDTPAPVVYGVYMLRHGDPVFNAWRYEGTKGLGMSLERYPTELQAFREAGVGRVSGCGFGCTLIRRQVLEQIPFRTGHVIGHAPDMPFALDCVRQGITQLARFDVKCGHIHKGKELQVQTNGEAGVKVKVLRSVNVLVEGSGVSLVEGEETSLPPKQAYMLADGGYVEVLDSVTKKVPRR